MLFYLSQKLLEWTQGTPWADHLSALRLFRYITVRSAGAAITALVLSWWLGPKIIRWLKQLKFGQDYADKAEEAGGLASARLEQERNADDGRRVDCHGAGFFDDAVDGMECAGGIDRCSRCWCWPGWAFTTITQKSSSRAAAALRRG